MNLTYGISQVMHRVRVKLYPSYLPGYENNYFARTDSEASLSVEQVCAALRDRGGFSGNYNDLVDYVKKYLDEAAYQLCDGYTINNRYYSIYPSVGGVFQSANETPDPKNHPFSFRFRPLTPLRKLAGSISIVVEGLAGASGYIDEYVDKDGGFSNSIFVPGNGFVINGGKIKVAGQEAGIGVFFVPVDNPGKAVKVTRVFENTPSKIIGIAPETGHTYNRIEIRTQFEGSSTRFLKNLRIIKSPFILEEEGIPVE